MSGYTKLFQKLIYSSVWQEDNPTRVLWITMLAMADRDGLVESTVPGLANSARITLEECEAALHKFQQPDKYSRSKTDEGRRIREVAGGFLLINHAVYRSALSAEEQREKAAARQQRYRNARKRDIALRGVTNNESNDIAEAEAEAEAKAEALEKRKEIRREDDHVNLQDQSEVVERIWKLHPASWRKNGPLGQVPPAYAMAILEAIARDGPLLVEQGTENYAAAVEKWPIPDRKFVISPVKFYGVEAHYLHDRRIWERAHDDNKTATQRRNQQQSELHERVIREIADAENLPAPLHKGAVGG